MLLEAAESQLVLVDYQARLMPALFESESVLANALRLAQLARLMRVPVWGTEQNPSRLGENPPALRALCDRTLAKMHFSAVEEGLGEWLRPPAKAPQGNARSLPKHLQKPAEPERGMIVIGVAGCGITFLVTARTHRGRPRPPHARLRPIRRRLVRLLHPASRRAPGQPAVLRARPRRTLIE